MAHGWRDDHIRRRHIIPRTPQHGPQHGHDRSAVPRLDAQFGVGRSAVAEFHGVVVVGRQRNAPYVSGRKEKEAQAHRGERRGAVGASACEMEVGCLIHWEGPTKTTQPRRRRGGHPVLPGALVVWSGVYTCRQDRAVVSSITKILAIGSLDLPGTDHGVVGKTSDTPTRT